jgi:hypothetical protein
VKVSLFSVKLETAFCAAFFTASAAPFLSLSKIDIVVPPDYKIMLFVSFRWFKHLDSRPAFRAELHVVRNNGVAAGTESVPFSVLLKQVFTG